MLQSSTEQAAQHWALCGNAPALHQFFSSPSHHKKLSHFSTLSGSFLPPCLAFPPAWWQQPPTRLDSQVSNSTYSYNRWYQPHVAAPDVRGLSLPVGLAERLTQEYYIREETPCLGEVHCPAWETGKSAVESTCKHRTRAASNSDALAQSQWSCWRWGPWY